MMENCEYLFMYAFTFFINGLISGTIGPLIPFLAAEARRSETDYFFVFICRSGGAILGAIIYKILQSAGLVSLHHKVLGFTSLIFFGCCLAFNVWKSLFGTGCLLTLFAGLNYFQNIAQNCSVLLIASTQKIFLWLSICHGSYGVGALTAPLVVNLLSTKAFIVPGICVLLTAPVYLLLLSSPHERREDTIQKKSSDGVKQDQDLASTSSSQVSNSIAILLGINYFFLHGTENVNGGWISSYATMSKIADKKTAAMFATIFWFSYTFARLASGCIDLKVSTKLKRLTELGFISAIACAILSFVNQKSIATILCAALQGIGVSGVFPLTLSIPYEFNMFVTESTLSNLMLLMMLSEGLLAATTGLLMQHIYNEVFFLSLILLNAVMFFNSRLMISSMGDQSSLSSGQGHVQLKCYQFYQAEAI